MYTSRLSAGCLDNSNRQQALETGSGIIGGPTSLWKRAFSVLKRAPTCPVACTYSFFLLSKFSIRYVSRLLRSVYDFFERLLQRVLLRLIEGEAESVRYTYSTVDVRLDDVEREEQSKRRA